MRYDMNLYDKLSCFEKLSREHTLNTNALYSTLEKCDALKFDYFDYMTTAPIDCDKELRRLSSADYDLCCALLTMLLREDHFSNGSLERRQHKGQVKPIIERMITCLKQNT